MKEKDILSIVKKEQIFSNLDFLSWNNFGWGEGIKGIFMTFSDIFQDKYGVTREQQIKILEEEIGGNQE